jgi:outer membrane autotransporter protein
MEARCASSNSVDALELDRDGFLSAASLEGGFPFHYGTQVVEPQAQWVYQTINSVQGSDPDAIVRFRDMDSLAARAGVRWANTWTLESDSKGIPRLFTGWLRLSLWHEFQGQPITEFSSAEGYVPFRTDMQGSWWQLNAGVTWQLSRTASFYANVGYQQGFGRSFDAWDGKLGFRWNW